MTTTLNSGLKIALKPTLKALALTVVLGTKSLMASSGFYLVTEMPENPSQGIAYKTSSDFRLNDNGYVQGGDNFLMGFNVQEGLPYDPNWDTNKYNLRLVKLLEDNRPVMQTNMLQTGFVLPLNDAIDMIHEHHWAVIDMEGKSHDVRGTLKKVSEANWSLVLDSFDALMVSRDFMGGPVIDEMNPLLLNFDPATGSLMDIEGMPGGKSIVFQWDMSTTTIPDTMLTFDLGMPGMHYETRLEDAAFGVSYEEQDGSAPSAIVSGRVDESGVFHTIYESGEEMPSFDIAYRRLGIDLGQAVEKAHLSADQVSALNAIFQ